MPTYKLTIEYEGTRYSGWQAQGNTQKTIQGHLIRAASDVFGEVDIGGAGRTDAGVHASVQVAHLRIRKAADPLQIARKINDLLPHDIHVLDAVRAADNFHARHDAISRVYLYQIATRRTAFAKPFVWWIKDRLVVDTCEAAVDEDLILLRIAASHFLWKMVRKLIAFLAEIVRGAIAPDAIEKMLGADAENFSPTAPPSGLFLEAVIYRGQTFNRALRPIVPVHKP